ncbi:hypothetical protein CI109_100780 [Kwoniella shandongensis]|uniref:Uncharacterized protein n=1 Tax=Kwoniella shandongensis TaxID=1734106 RepID=A0A5M6BWI2_9TREE|nr:uncharacterized protein CI109_005041 [Kwoniella shandongensis]KAA5526651.1 hypothetical protein CI109_005041 [Kwoniella shandongensis]
MAPKRGRPSRQSTAATAASTTSLQPPNSPSQVTRRLTRSAAHTSTPAVSGESASSTSSSPDDTPSPSPDPEMYRENKTLRGRNVEDLNDVEEKGLLMRRTDSSESEGGMQSRRRRGKEREEGGRLEQIVLDDGGEQEEGGGGLTSRRDKEAFALLVVLCEPFASSLHEKAIQLTGVYFSRSSQTCERFLVVDLERIAQTDIPSYRLQGIPLGLTFGTLPFLLKSHLSYSQLAIFALSTWPYSLKLLWSPIVDAWFVKKWGRRKSWIVPVQGLVGLGMWIIGGRVGGWLEAETIDIKFITGVFGALILAAATQDIAVDGWALTLLSQPNLSYASTAQTIGIGIGNALSFTVFLAFNSVEFSNKYFRSTPLDYPLVSLGGYLRFWAVVFVAVTAWLAFFKTEDPASDNDPDMDVKKVYKVMWSIVRLKNIQSFLLVHLVCKIGFQVNDAVTSLKLLEKGLSKEDLAIAVLIDFPAQMAIGWLAAKWARPVSTPTSGSSKRPLTGPASGEVTGVLKPWLYAFWARLAMAAIAALVVKGFPSGGVGNGYFALVIMTTLLSSLTSTVQFVGICAFHTQIADPLIGGTYMTLLNTVSNLGGTWPKPLILRSVDLLTVATCSIPTSLSGQLSEKLLLGGHKSGPGYGECITEHGKSLCATAGGQCIVQRDGYYIMSILCVSLGAGLLIMFILPTIRRLSSLPMSAWRVKIPN